MYKKDQIIVHYQLYDSDELPTMIVRSDVEEVKIETPKHAFERIVLVPEKMFDLEIVKAQTLVDKYLNVDMGFIDKTIGEVLGDEIS